MFPIYCKATGSLVSINMSTGAKSYFLIAMMTSIIGGMGLVSVLLISVFRMRIENTIIGGRIDETIEILDNKLFYTFRTKYQTPMNQKNLVVIDLNQISSFSFDENLFEISTEGIMIEKIVDVSVDVHKIKKFKMANGNLKIWDYFTPSLCEVLKSKTSV